MTTFIRLTDVDRKDEALLRECRAPGARSIVVDPADFGSVPGSPFAYWVPRQIRQLFQDEPAVEHADERLARIGLTTHDDFRWLRLCWESPVVSPSCVPFAKGGTVRKFYADLHLCVDWGQDGRRLKVSKAERHARGELTGNNSRCWNESHYFRAGITWPRRASGLSFRALPRDAIFGDKGPAVFVQGDDRDALMVLLAILNSSTFETLMKLQVARVTLAQSFEVGLVRNSPLPSVPPDVSVQLGDAARRGWSSTRLLDDSRETARAFTLPALLRGEKHSFVEAVDAWLNFAANTFHALTEVQREIDELCFSLYGISEENRAEIVAGFSVGEDDNDQETDDEGLDDHSELSARDPRALAAELVSWCVGVAAGRFDVRMATGTRERPQEPDPFDPLPTCSPGMLIGEGGRPLPAPPEGYPVEVSSVLVDDPGHRLDITDRVRFVFEVVFSDDADRWWSDVGDVLGAQDREVGSWLSKGFFDHHLKTYSKSRRRAPIYWPLGTTSGSYVVWLYAHCVTGDSLFRVLNDVVSPKLVLERRRLSELVQNAGPNPAASQRKTIDGQEKLVAELQQLVEHLTAAAPLWHPDLNDGIVVMLAPLWRLFAHHKSLSKELRAHWEKLVAGEYDWAHLAMHLWPERVVPKCAEDRSLAIAHGLEDVLWVTDEGTPEKWHLRQIPTVAVEQLIADRTDPATKAALENAVR